MNAHTPSADPALSMTVAPAAAAEDVPRGCAWFDSSLDLRLGLRVRELDLSDPRGGDAFLDGWLAWVMATPSPGWRMQQA